MKKIMLFLSAVFLLLGTAGLASAITIDYYSTTPTDGSGLTTPNSWATVETFDSPNGLLWNWSPAEDFTIRDGNLGLDPGQSAPPAGDTTNYVSIPEIGDEDHNASVEVTGLGGSYDYFGIFWGSVDDYNTIDFYNGIDLVGSFSGTQAISPGIANGNQTAPGTNLYVNFYFGDETFDSFVMSSTRMAFEADNIAVGTAPVPEPATMLLLGTGLLGIAGIRRKRKK